MIFVAAGFMDVFSVIVGVILALTGLSVALMGAIALTEGVAKRGGIALVSGLVALGVGLWMIGAIP